LQAIESAIVKSCGISTDALIQKSDLETPDQIDNGIRDVHYTTVFETQLEIAKNTFEVRRIIVQSFYADMYDHQAQEWGSYSVQNVNCNAQ